MIEDSIVLKIAKAISNQTVWSIINIIADNINDLNIAAVRAPINYQLMMLELDSRDDEEDIDVKGVVRRLLP